MQPEPWGTMPDGTPVHRVLLANRRIEARILTYGAAIQALHVPDRDGNRANVVLGLQTLADYAARSPHFGAVPGRYAGRIAAARFTLDGTVHHLVPNDGPNTLHGGPASFGKRAWRLAGHGPTHADLSLTSPDGDAGFPGTLDVSLRYQIDGSSLSMHVTARTDRPTVLNLTNHSYFNLSGEGSGSIEDHVLAVPATRYVPVDAAMIPTGAIQPVASTPFDFTEPRRIGDRLRDGHPQLLLARGYDHTLMIDGSGLRPAARVHDPVTGRTLTVLSTQPALQLYTGNMLNGTLAGPSGQAYRQGDALCLEAQHVPDSPNRPQFPSTVLRPGQAFAFTTVFRFGVDG